MVTAPVMDPGVPSQQQACVVAMLLPAGQLSATLAGMPCPPLPPPANVAAFEEACRKLQCSLQQMQPGVFVLTPPSQLQQAPQVQEQGPVPSHQLLYSDAGIHAKHDQLVQEASSKIEEQHGRLTASASRRLRRKRAAQRAMTTEEVGHIRAQSRAANAPLPAGHVSFSESTEDSKALVIEQMRESLSGENGSAVVRNTLQALRGHVWELSRHPTGCRLVQEVLQIASQQEAASLVKELHGHVLEASVSPHANFVLQKVVVQLALSISGFVADELLGSCARIARHRYGCRIFCRLLEFFSGKEVISRLADELLVDTEALCRHEFGTHVVQSILEHGEERHRKQVAATLLSDPLGFAKHRFASYLIETALRHCSVHDQEALLSHFRHADIIVDLAQSQRGHIVARSLLRDDRTEAAAAVATLKAMTVELERCKHGPRLLSDLQDLA